MKYFKKIALKIYMLMTSGVAAKYLISAVLCSVLMVILGLFNLIDYTEVINIIIGFLLGQVVVGLMAVVGSKFEDVTKVTEDTDKLLGIYKLKKYNKTVFRNGTACNVCYNEVFVPSKENPVPIKVDDSPEKDFELDDFLMGCYTDLFQAHEHSAKFNFKTTRIDDFTKENDGYHIKTSRSTYYNHLVTNRVADFRLADDFSVRDMFEYGPEISRLNQSKMSNHIGVNGLVYLNDGVLLIPKRKAEATFSKNKITSSIAIMLSQPKDGTPFDENYLIYGGMIKSELANRVRIPEKVVENIRVQSEFIGFGQNLYEVGKPQFYYVVNLDMDKKQYLECLKGYSLGKGKKIDTDECIFMVDPNSIEFIGEGDIKFRYFTEKDVVKGKSKASGKKHLTYEKSFACNLWHEDMYNDPEKYQAYLKEMGITADREINVLVEKEQIEMER